MVDIKSGVTVGNLAVFADVFGNIKDGGSIPASGLGTVTSVATTVTQGVTATVTNPTTHPSIAIGLGVITPTSVNASGTVAGSNLSGTNTGDDTAIDQVLTGFASGAGTVSSSDTVLTAIEKLNGNTALLTGAVVFQGTWNANSNSPVLQSGVGTKGTLYKVSVPGSTDIDGITQWNVGDSIVFDGTVWDKLDGLANEVISVQGLTGAVTVTDVNLSMSDNLSNNASTAQHGFLPKLSGNTSQFLNGNGAWGTPSGIVTSVQGSTGDVTITDANISVSDITTNNVTASAHGFAPKLSGSATQFLNGTGGWTVPAGGASGNSIVEFSSLQSGTGLNANTTYYLGDGSQSTSGATAAFVRMPYAGTISSMYADTPLSTPGTSQSFAYTLYKNGVATSLTCTTSGANLKSSDTSHSVAFVAGDTLSVKVVTSTSANQTYHQVTLQATS